MPVSVFDRYECPDRRVAPDLRCGVEWQFDAPATLGCSEGSAVEGVEGFAAVEVADPADAWVVVAAAIGVGAAHTADGDVLEDSPGAECGWGGGHAGVAGGGEHCLAVVPEGQEWRGVLVHG